MRLPQRMIPAMSVILTQFEKILTHFDKIAGQCHRELACVKIQVGATLGNFTRRP